MGAMKSRLRDLVLPALFAVAACARPARDAHDSGSYTYDVSAPREGSRVVAVVPAAIVTVPLAAPV